MNDKRAACLDHVVPYSKGGTNRAENLVTCCKKCNAAKSDKTPSQAGFNWPNGLGEYLDKDTNTVRQHTVNTPLTGGPAGPDKEGVKEKENGREREEEGQGVVAAPIEFIPENLLPIAIAPATEKQETVLQAVCRQTWAAYADAYERRYGAAPVRNAKVSTQVKTFVQRIGHDESLSIAEWFVAHPGGYYVSRMHDFGCLLNDAEKLRTEWATGRVMTQGRARQSDRTGTTGAALAEVLAELGDAA